MSDLDSSTPREDQGTRHVFDDVIEQRVVRSLIHDLRSPMAVLGGYFASDSRAESHEVRDRARAAFEQSDRLLGEFIDTVQTGLFEQPSVLEDTNVAGFLVDVARLHSGAMRTAVPAMTLKIRPAKLRAVVDTRKLRRVLNNLISNAVRHSGATRLVLGARIMDGKLVIVIGDNGRGLDPEHRDWVTRLNSDRDKREGSLLKEMDRLSGGLGLLIASRYAREMGGRLEHVASVNSGALFLIWTGTHATRARQRINQAALRDSGPNRVPLIGKSIAILEQDPQYLAALEHTFGNLGASVFAAMDPVQLLANLGAEEGVPDLLLVGLLPDKRDQSRNVRLLRQLQAGYKDRDFPLIAMTRDPCNIALRNFNKCAFVLEKPLAREWVDAIARAMIAKEGTSFRRRLEKEGLFIQRWNALPGRKPQDAEAAAVAEKARKENSRRPLVGQGCSDQAPGGIPGSASR
jgi:anti-sigma regulatory factor (Ser/Thr protein kinase)/CheY-like chemotaxis protein